jgi:hypothetical protein
VSANGPGAERPGPSADHGIVGGSVYDALVGEAARHDGRVLRTRDRRAPRSYRSLEVVYRFVE